MGIRFAKRVWDHYASFGRNASYVARSDYPVNNPAEKCRRRIVTLQFRAGRRDEGEHVQMEINIHDIYASTTRDAFSSLSFDADTWARIVAFVERDRDLDREDYKGITLAV